MHMWNNEETFKDKYFYRIWKLRFKIQEIINTSTFNKRKANNASDTDKSLSVLSYIK